MKRLFIPIILTLFCFATPLFAQVELCQGAYFTEAQGKEFLQKNEVKTLAEWKSRADNIRANILEGMDLLPPVSYTHLDVYKRQSPYTSVW